MSTITETWKRELTECITGREALEHHLRLEDGEKEALRRLEEGDCDRLPLRISPHYLALIDPDRPACPIRRMVVPRTGDWTAAPGEGSDPLDEDRHTVAPRLVRRYPDRVLFLVNDACASYCRFCTRGRWTGRFRGAVSEPELKAVLQYLSENPEIREVILSGGDPLLLDDGLLGEILCGLGGIPSVRRLRVGTRVPVRLPSRITGRLTALLKEHQPLYLLTHFNHPRELAPPSLRALALLADNGVPLLNQTVLLHGINDDLPTLVCLMEELSNNRVRPYYLHHCDPSPGTGLFRVPLERGLELVTELRRLLPGLSLPAFVVDLPGGAGKVPINPQVVVGKTGGGLLIRGLDGRTYPVLDP